VCLPVIELDLLSHCEEKIDVDRTHGNLYQP